MKTLDEKLAGCKHLVIYEGVEECNKLLVQRERKMRILNGEYQGLIKHASLPVLEKAQRGDNITNIPGLGVPSDEELTNLMQARQMPMTPELLGRVVPWFGSDERVDGDGDIVRQNWDFEDFQDNSPMPFSHSWEQPPVGRVIDWKVVQRNDSDYSGPALWLLCMFATADEWEFADSVFRLVQTGILKGGSVGFFSTRIIDVTDEEERNELGLGRFGLILDQNTLLEFSPATIPANPGAVALRARKAGPAGLKSHDMHVVRELIRQEDTRLDRTRQWSAHEEVLLAAMKSLFPKETYTFHKDLDVPVTASVSFDTKEPETNVEDLLDMDELKKLTEAVEDLAKAFGEHKSMVETKLSALEVASQQKAPDPPAAPADNPPAAPADNPPAAPADTGDTDDDLKTLFGNLDSLQKVLVTNTDE